MYHDSDSDFEIGFDDSGYLLTDTDESEYSDWVRENISLYSLN